MSTRGYKRISFTEVRTDLAMYLRDRGFKYYKAVKLIKVHLAEDFAIGVYLKDESEVRRSEFKYVLVDFLNFHNRLHPGKHKPKIILLTEN